MCKGLLAARLRFSHSCCLQWKHSKSSTEKMSSVGILSHRDFLFVELLFLCWSAELYQPSVILVEHTYLSHLAWCFPFLWVFIGLQHFQPASHSASAECFTDVGFSSSSLYSVCFLFSLKREISVNDLPLGLSIGGCAVLWVSQCFHFLAFPSADHYLCCQHNSLLFLAEVRGSCARSLCLPVAALFALAMPLCAYWFENKQTTKQPINLK